MLSFALPPGPLRVLGIGAHCDDLEIGAGATLRSLVDARPESTFEFVVMTSNPEREAETRSCLQAFVAPSSCRVTVHDLPDTRLPWRADEVKDLLAKMAQHDYDLVLTHHARDAHQDHRFLGEFVPTAFRNHLIWHFEIPKWDGDLGASGANLYCPLTSDQVEQKWQLLNSHHRSQWGKDWWGAETFAALARLRGMECRAPYAEAFRVNKARVQW